MTEASIYDLTHPGWRDEEIARLRDTVERLMRGLNIIAKAGMLHGGAWCVAQAIGHRDNLDFDEFPEQERRRRKLANYPR